MAAMVCSTMNSNCCSSAAACSSARIRPILDTAVCLVVSICVLVVRIILLYS